MSSSGGASSGSADTYVAAYADTYADTYVAAYADTYSVPPAPLPLSASSSGGASCGYSGGSVSDKQSAC